MDNKKLEALCREFTAAYSFLYEYGDNTPAYNAAVADFDKELEKQGTVFNAIRFFSNHRADPISSDRECAAFMIAYKKVFGV